jgi:hypothetical protein
MVGYTVSMSIAAALPLLALIAAGWQFPIPAAEPEFRRLMPHVGGLCEQLRGNVGAFWSYSMPYAPLSIEVRRAKTPTESDQLRNLFLGVAGGACQVDPRQLTDRFHCGPTCTQSRRKQTTERLPALKQVATAFRKLKGVWLISHWGVPDDFRVNDLFHMLGGQTNEALPSESMGFVPSDLWKGWPDVAAYLAHVGAPADQVHAVLAGLRDQMLAVAVVRDGKDVRVIRIGIGDNESGVIFVGKHGATPVIGAVTTDGRKYTVVERLEPGVYFYETT